MTYECSPLTPQRTICVAESHAVLIFLQRRHHLIPGLGLEELPETQDELLLGAAVRHGQQPLHYLDEAVVLKANTAAG